MEMSKKEESEKNKNEFRWPFSNFAGVRRRSARQTG
jgi:hypothetical protein